MIQAGLILDISFSGFTAVVDAAEKPLAQRWRAPGERYDDVSSWIEECLNEADADYSSLNWIAVNVGPGSFTGIRIAMAFAQGLAMPRNLSLVGFTSFAPLFLSYAPQANEKVVCAIPANSGRFYVSTHLHAEGLLMEGDEFMRLANDETTLVVPARTPAMEAALSKFQNIHAIEERWNVQALTAHVRSENRDAIRPYYLQLSAAEEKALG